MKMKIQYPKLIASIIICQLAGIIGSVFTSKSVTTWYPELIKPFFNPPAWIFGPVWVTLYLLMGISLYLVWTTKNKNSKIALTIFGIQLALNTAWSIIFFGIQSPFWAFIEIIFLWSAIILTMFYFYKISKKAMYLLIPYILWVSFAMILNFAIYYLN